MQEELRLYSFVNFYLSSIQQGIQTGHMTDNMSVDYLIREHKDGEALYREWIKSHKTYIILNGGDDEMINSTYTELYDLCRDLSLPFGWFREPGLGGIMTCVGAVIPAKYFMKDDTFADACELWAYRKGSESSEYRLCKLLKSRPLAK